MMRLIRITSNMAVVLPLLTGLVGAMALPEAAYAIFRDDGSSYRGNAPERRVLTTHELLRLNDNTLLDMTVGVPRINLTIKGPMGVYSSHHVANAVRYQRDRARRLIERLENAQSEAEKKEIIEGLRRAAERRHKASEMRLEKEGKILRAEGLLKVYPDILAPPEIRNNKRVQAYYALLRSTYAQRRYVEMLSGMLRVHTREFRTLFDL